MKRNLIVLSVAILALTAAFLSGKWKAHKAAPGVTITPLFGQVKGAMAPDFALTSLDGKTVHLVDYRGVHDRYRAYRPLPLPRTHMAIRNGAPNHVTSSDPVETKRHFMNLQ